MIVKDSELCRRKEEGRQMGFERVALLARNQKVANEESRLRATVINDRSVVSGHGNKAGKVKSVRGKHVGLRDTTVGNKDRGVAV